MCIIRLPEEEDEGTYIKIGCEIRSYNSYLFVATCSNEDIRAKISFDIIWFTLECHQKLTGKDVVRMKFRISSVILSFKVEKINIIFIPGSPLVHYKKPEDGSFPNANELIAIGVLSYDKYTVYIKFDALEI